MCLSCGSLVAGGSEGGLAPGVVLAGKYEIVEEIAAGGMGRIYQAVQRPLGTSVVIKTLHASSASDPQFTARFEREARTTSQLRHPNIVTVFDYGMHVDGTSYLVLELVEGESLAVLSRRGIMSAARAVRILAQVCDALSFAHGHGVVHRDLKPANIMVVHLPSEPDFVKVLDFGSALMLQPGEDAERLTRVGTVIGTPAYMAPEYILGRGVDGRIDVYAVGVLLYALLTGTPPFRGDAQAVFAQQVTAPPEPPRRRNPRADIPIALEQVIAKALAKDPAKRFASAAELKVAMERALTGEGLDSYPPISGQWSDSGVEIAHRERSVVALSVAAPTGGALDTEMQRRVAEVAAVYGGVPSPKAASLFVFGLDRDPQDAASDAMRCALEIAAWPPPRLRLGLHDAHASCHGRYGSPGFKWELFGEGTNVSERLASHAADGQALVSGPAARHAPSDLTLTPVLPPSDLNEPVFVVTDPLRDDERFGRPLPFVGRETEQRVLLEVAASANDGGVCIVEGDAGIGKSRLVREVAAQAARIGVLWSVIPANARDDLGPAHPVSLLAALGWTAPASGGSTTERYAIDMMLGRQDRIADGLSGDRSQLRLVAAALEGVARRAEQGPVVVVLDELHLADDLTWAVARRLVDMAGELRVSVVLSIRDAHDLPLSPPERSRHVVVPPLSLREVQALADAVDVDADVAQRLPALSGGLPLVLDEIVRTVRVGAADELASMESLSPRDVVQSLVRVRAEMLSPDARRILHAAAVLGLEPREQEALELAGTGKNDMRTPEELPKTALLHHSPDGRLLFASWLAWEAVLDSIPSAARQKLHARAAELIRRRGGELARAAEIGEHLLAAGRSTDAIEMLRRAARFAHAQGSAHRAIRLLRLAADAASEEPPVDRAAIAHELGNLAMQAGDLAEAEVVLRDAFPLARQADASELAAELLRLHGRVLALQGATEDGWNEIEAALAYAEKRSFVTVAAESCADLAEAAEARGRYDEAAVLLRRGLDLIEARDDRTAAAVRLQLYNRLGRLELSAGNTAGAIALFTQALGLADKLHDRYQGAGLLGNLGGAYARRNEMDRAMHYTERALRASETLGDQIGISRQSFNLALLRLSIGQATGARQLLRQSYEAARRAGWREGLAMSAAAIAKLGVGPAA